MSTSGDETTLRELEKQLLALEQAVGEIEVDGESNIFDILGIRTRERRHTRFLSWLLDPEDSHNAGWRFLDSFLDECGVQVEGEIAIRSFVPITTGTGDDNAEIDLVIRGRDTVVGVEIKTTHQDHVEKLDKEAAALTQKYPGYDVSELVYLAYSGGIMPKTDYPTAQWNDLMDLFEADLAAVPDNYETRLIIDFIRTIRTHVMTEFDGISEQAELYLNHKSAIEGVRDAYTSDRDRCFNAIKSAFYSLPDISEDEWNYANRSEYYIKFYKPRWNAINGVSIEYEPHLKLRADDSEIRLRLDVEGKNRDSMRQPLRPKLETDEHRLQTMGWEYTEDSNYSFLAKSVPLTHDDGGQDSIDEAMGELHEFHQIVESQIDAVVEEQLNE